MHLEKFNLYHIFNQGNNRQKLFFCDVNYLFFIEKLRWHILPYADVLAWCLMPNHFHLMVYVREVESQRSASQGFTGSEALTKHSFNHSIGIMLRSYTRAIHKQENISGSLFRKETKAICLTQQQGVTPSFFDTGSGAVIYQRSTEREYPQVCFNYIHNNPVEAGLVKRPGDWPYSSYRELMGLGGFQLAQVQKVKELGLHIALCDSPDDFKSSDESPEYLT